MKVWLLFIWVNSAPSLLWSYDTKAECLKDADKYKRPVCVEVTVPKT